MFAARGGFFGSPRPPKILTAYGDAQISTAEYKIDNASAKFDGSGDYVTIPTDISLTLPGDFTVETWYRVSNTTVPLIPFLNTGSHLFYIGQDSGPKYAVFHAGLNRLLSSVLSISNNTWYHAAFVRSGTTLKAYHNGTEVASVTHSTTITSGNPNIIANYSSYYLNGYLDEFRISNSARYTTAFTPATSAFSNDANTVLLLHCDGTNGSNAFTDDTLT